MEKKLKNTLYSFIYLLCLYFGIQLLPLSEWIPMDWLFHLVKSLCFAGIIVLIIIEIKRIPVEVEKPKRRIHPLFVLPLILGAGSNILYGFIFQQPMNREIQLVDFIGKLSTTALAVIIEELLFRILFLRLMWDLYEGHKYQEELTILFSALAFALMHCINFFGSAPLAVLAQIGYTFVLGLVLGVVALRIETPVLPIVAHFLFNFLNTNLYVALFNGNTDMAYFLFNGGLSIIIVAYFGLVYFIYRRKEHAS
jgi:hypothetical protein